MKNIIAAIILASSIAIATTVSRPTSEVLNQTRPCMLAAGGWTEVDCSGAAAYSSKLTANANYLFQPTADDVYLSFHSASSGGDADSGDLELDQGEVVRFTILAGSQYMTCDGNAGGNSGKIKYIECQ